MMGMAGRRKMKPDPVEGHVNFNGPMDAQGWRYVKK